MQTKLVEVHDNGMTIMVLAIRLTPTSRYERLAFVNKLGFRDDGGSVVLMELDGMRATADPYHWPSMGAYPRTLPSAHVWIIKNFDKMLPGEVIDVALLVEANLYPNRDTDVSAPSRMTETDDGNGKD